jgi:hypothetical protein
MYQHITLNILVVPLYIFQHRMWWGCSWQQGSKRSQETHCHELYMCGVSWTVESVHSFCHGCNTAVSILNVTVYAVLWGVSLWKWQQIVCGWRWFDCFAVHHDANQYAALMKRWIFIPVHSQVMKAVSRYWIAVVKVQGLVLMSLLTWQSGCF